MRIADYVQVERVDHKGREYADFYPRRNHMGPGYVVMGRCTDATWYDGRLFKVCAALAKRYKNGRLVRTGFRRELDAYQFALYLNGTDAGSIK